MLVLSAGVLVASIGLAYLTAGQQEFPRLLVDSFPFIDWVNSAQDWLRQNVRGVTRSIAGVIGDSLNAVETFMLDLSWPIVMLGFALPALRYGGLRLAESRPSRPISSHGKTSTNTKVSLRQPRPAAAVDWSAAPHLHGIVKISHASML